MITLRWLLKHVVLPLLPFFIGASIRCLFHNGFSINAFSPAELSFSMAMLTMVISLNASRLNNPNLRETISSLYQLGAFVFLILFSWAIFIEADKINLLNNLFKLVEQHINSGKVISVNDFPKRVFEFDSILSKLRVATISLSLAVVPLSIYSNKKFQLEEI